MSELDGVWAVERISGALPPLAGMRKRIRGEHGETIAGPVRFSFDVDGRELRYRAPLLGLVDVLEPDGAGFRGRATVYGVPVGEFNLRRIEMVETLNEQLIKHIDEALAMEQNVLRMLESMIDETDDPEIKQELRQHRVETETHADRMRRRLEAHGATPSRVREAGGILGALMKSVLDKARGESAGRNARDGYATEHLEIASYELLERVATRAGDEETAQAARENRADEEAMAKKIESNWDTFAELSLEEAGVTY